MRMTMMVKRGAKEKGKNIIAKGSKESKATMTSYIYLSAAVAAALWTMPLPCSFSFDRLLCAMLNLNNNNNNIANCVICCP